MIEFPNLLGRTDDGMRFLKLRSLSRKEYLEYLIGKFQLKMGDLTSRQWLQPIYESTIQSEDIDDVIQDLFEKERKIRRDNEQQLICNELYKVQSLIGVVYIRIV